MSFRKGRAISVFFCFERNCEEKRFQNNFLLKFERLFHMLKIAVQKLLFK